MEYGHSLFYFDFAGTRLAIAQTLSLSQPAGTANLPCFPMSPNNGSTQAHRSWGAAENDV